MGCGASTQKGQSSVLKPPSVADAKEAKGEVTSEAATKRDILATNDISKSGESWTTAESHPNEEMRGRTDMQIAQDAGDSLVKTNTAAPDATPATKVKNHEPTKPPSLRIFVTSGPDMDLERQLMDSQIIPALQHDLQQRGITALNYIDMRYPDPFVPTTPTTLLTTLQAIELCRPYYIAILGTSTGWVPTLTDPAHVAPDTLPRYPFLRQCEGMGWTEIQVTFALLEGGCGGEGLVYVKDGFGSEEVEKTMDFDETASIYPLSDDDILARRKHMRALVEKLEKSPRACVRRFTDTQDLADMIRKDMNEILGSGSAYAAKDYWDQERDVYKGFARAIQKDFVLKEDILGKMDARLEEGGVMVVTGPTGRGVSTVLGSWILHREGSDVRHVVYHFCGCTPESADPIAVFGRLVHELQIDTTTKPEDVASTFSTRLQTIAKPTIIVISAVNLLPPPYQTLDWVPSNLPQHVKLVISCTESSPSTRSARQRGWKEIRIGPLTAAEKQSIINNHSASAEEIDSATINRVIQSKYTDNPLYLNLLLMLTEIPPSLPPNPTSLLIHHLTKLESVFSPDMYPPYTPPEDSQLQTNIPYPNPIVSALTLIAISRTGLTEYELRALIGDSHRTWAIVLVNVIKLVQSEGGRFVPRFGIVRDVVMTRYIPSGRLRKGVYKVLAGFFARRLKDVGGIWDVRSVKEVAWALIGCDNTVNLRAWLVRDEVVRCMIGSGLGPEMKELWEKAGGCSIGGKIYEKVVSGTRQDQLIETLRNGHEGDPHEIDPLWLSMQESSKEYREFVASFLESCGEVDVASRIR